MHSTLTIKERVLTDVFQLVDLYTLIGWNKKGNRTPKRVSKMLEQSQYFVSVYCNNKLVGFGRILGDEYVAQILDVITHPDYRRQGIATKVMLKLMQYIESLYEGAFLIDGSQLPQFYKKFRFEKSNPKTNTLMYYSCDKKNE